MSDLFRDIAFLRWRGGDLAPAATVEQKLDLLAQMVANLVDEVEFLEQMAQRASGLPWAQWREEYVKQKMWNLFSSQGAPPACVRKYQPYVQSREEAAAELVPDETARNQQIQNLGSLT